MKFQDIPYRRITQEEITERYQQLFEGLKNARTREDCLAVLEQRYQLSRDMTPIDLCYTRNSMDCNDSFFAAERSYYNEIGPVLSGLACEFNRELLGSPIRPIWEELLGPQAIAIMETGLLCYDSRLAELSREESSLCDQYQKLTSNACVEWEGASIPRSQMGLYTQSAHRETRKHASLAVSRSWEAQRPQLEDIYHKLTANRHKQAQAMGYSNYVDFSYYRMVRIGYGSREVAAFRQAVKKYMVPLHQKLEEKRRQRLGLEHLYYYDSGISFVNGNPKPLGDTQFCLDATREMYSRLSPETGEFIQLLLDNGLYDVDIRPGKQRGGYMISFEAYRVPFIFANFDGTSQNAYIMCHEGGHAFQYFLKRQDPIREHCWLTSEIGESHAMSMELFTYPYMELFFGDRAQDYRTQHLENTLWRIAFQCEQDEFQQLVFEEPDMSPQERNQLWAKLEAEYFPGKDVADNHHLKDGCGWQHILHTFLWPFYAIDYGLAQVVALEFYQMAQTQPEEAWQSYLAFCRKTGELNFSQLLEMAGLKSPFQEDTIRELADWLEGLLLA